MRINASYVGLESSLVVEWDDGTVQEDDLKKTTGEPDNPVTWDGAYAKFLSLATGVYGEELARKVCAIVSDLETCGVRTVMDLVK